MEIPKLENLDHLLANYLGNDRTIIDHETSRLIATGENYGSLMLALKFLIKTKQKTEILELVAKVPPRGEFIQKMFNIPVTFRNEVEFYKAVVPELESFLQEKGLINYLDCFPKYYGARLSLTQDEYADDSAILLLENLKSSGYGVIDRTVGFDLETSRTVLQTLAKFHAVPLALKILKPEIFGTRIKSLFAQYKMFQLDDAMYAKGVEKIINIIKDAESCKPHIEKVREVFFATPFQTKNDPKLIREPWATIIHTDAWVNNFMLKGSTSCKIVDFQLYEYGSPARDVLFFIYSSIQSTVVRDFYDDLIRLYYGTVVETLDKLGCDSSGFVLEEFQEEISLAAREGEFVHTMFMLQPIFATKETIKELDELREEDLVAEQPISVKHKEQAAFVVEEFVTRKLI